MTAADRVEGALLLALAGLLGASAVAQLLPALTVLAVGEPAIAAVDLVGRLDETRAVVDGSSPYTLPGAYAAYPPATYPLLAPLLLVSATDARGLWALSTVALLAALGGFGAARVRGGAPGRLAALVTPFGIAGVAYGVQQGQLHVHALAAAVAAIALAARPSGTAARDALAGALFAASLAKPTLTAPLFPLLVALPGRTRPAVVAAAVYAGLTALSLALVGQGVSPVFDWLTLARVGATYGAGGSYGNVHAWSGLLGLEALDAALTLALLGGAFAFGLAQRQGPYDGRLVLLRLGVLAVLARTFAYHQDYDDSLVVLLLFALLARPLGRWPGLVLAIALGALHVLPRRFLAVQGDAGSWLAWARPALWFLGAALCVAELRRTERIAPSAARP